MGDVDRLKNEAQKAKGKIKEGVGDLTDDDSLEAEGRADQAAADVKNAGESIKDAARRTKDALTE